MAIPITITELSDSIRAATVVVNEKERQIAVSLWDLLADGHPVSPRALAARARVDQAAVDSALERWPGIFRDEENLVVGFWGLAIPPMAIVSTPKAESQFTPGVLSTRSSSSLLSGVRRASSRRTRLVANGSP